MLTWAQRHKTKKGMVELPGAQSPVGDTESATASHCPLSLSVSFDFLHPRRIPVPFSGNSFPVYSSQATCLPILWVLLWKEQGVTPARPSESLSWSEPGHLYVNSYYAYYNVRTTHVGAALISSVMLHCDTKECLKNKKLKCSRSRSELSLS